MGIPAVAEQTTADCLRAVDEACPGLVEGLYLTGSVALDDFHPGASDVDFVAVTAKPLGEAELSTLDAVHRRLPARPVFEGVYVTWAELAAGPVAAPTGAHVLGRGLARNRAGARNPVRWHELARHGVTVRGPEPADIEVWTDRAALGEWVRGNANRYWVNWHRRGSRLLSVRGMLLLRDWGPAWCVLGVSRQHYTLTTGEITSKRGAGEHAFAAFAPRWRPIVAETLRIRTQSPEKSGYRNRFARRRDALDFLAMVIAEINATD